MRLQIPGALVLGCLLTLVGLVECRTLFQTSIYAPRPAPPAQILPSNGSKISWPATPPGTIRFAVALADPALDVTAREISDGYRFWEASVNAAGGIDIGGGKRLRVEVLFALDGGDAGRHADLLRAAATAGGADFLLGAATGMAWLDKATAEEHDIITMLCCHGPPNVYAEAAAAGDANRLFGVHVSSELYTEQLVRHIAVNHKAQRIAVTVLLDEAAPLQGSLFTNTTCAAAVRQLEAIAASGIYVDPPYHEVVVVPTSQAANVTFFNELARGVKVGGYDVVLACALAADGANLMRALEAEQVPLKALFVTVAPTSQPTVAGLAAAGVEVEHVLSAGQWHPELVFAYNDTDLGREAWTHPASFARAFAAYSNGSAATYTVASAAAAAYALQLGLEGAFQDCDLTAWGGDVDELLYRREWPCRGGGGGGYARVLAALRDLNQNTFFGNIRFDATQRNRGRKAVTTQLLGAAGRAAGIFPSIDFGLDGGANATRLVQEVVLPSGYQTREIEIPRPKRPYDPDSCPDGYGLDAAGACQRCARGSVRRSLNNNGTSFECLLCGLESFADEEGLAECKQCPAGTATLRAGATALANCVCKPGFVNERMEDGSECLECPEGAVCPGGRKMVMAKPGYWLEAVNASAGVTADDIQRCSPPEVCVNRGNQTCAEGWGGDMCSLCGYNNGDENGDNYYLFFGSCEKCISNMGNSIIILTIFVAWVLLNLVVAENYESIALVIDWMQLMSLVGTVNANWPSSLRRFFTVARLFAFEVDVVSWRCLSTQWTFTADLILQFSLPLVITGLWGAVAFLASWRQRVRSRQEASKRGSSLQCIDTSTLPSGCAPDNTSSGSDDDGERRRYARPAPAAAARPSTLPRSSTMVRRVVRSAVGAGQALLRRASDSLDRLMSDRTTGLSWATFVARMLSIFEITYLASTQYAMAALRTVTVRGETRLAAAPYLAQSPAIVALGSVGLAIYGVLFPLLLFLALARMSPSWPGRVAHRTDDDPKSDRGGFMHITSLQLLGWLYAKFRVERWYMAAAHLLHRFLMVAAVMLLVRTELQLLVSAFVTVSFACLFIAAQPYYIRRLNVMQCILYVSVLFQLFFAACFYSPYVSFWNPDWITSFTIVSLVFIGVAAGTFAWIFLMELVEWLCMRGAKRALCRRFPRSRWRRLGALVDVFNAYRLHSWVAGEVAASRQPDAAAAGAMRAHPDAQELATPGLLLFAEVAKRLEQYLGPNNEYVYLSTKGNAMLWRQLVLTYPELLTYLFNERDGDAEHWGQFFRRFYAKYWRREGRPAQKRLFTAPAWARKLAASLPVAEKMPSTPIETRDSEVTVDLAKEAEPLLARGGGQPATPAPPLGPPLLSAAWLIRRRDRAVLAHWLATHGDADPARQMLVALMRAIARGAHRSWEERMMRVLTFNSLSCFHEVPPQSDRRLSKVFSSEMGSRSAEAVRTCDEAKSPAPAPAPAIAKQLSYREMTGAEKAGEEEADGAASECSEPGSVEGPPPP